MWVGSTSMSPARRAALDLRPGHRHRPGAQGLPESSHQAAADDADLESAQVAGRHHGPVGGQHPFQPPQPVPAPVDDTDARLAQRFDQSLTDKRAVEKGPAVGFGAKGIRQGKGIEAGNEGVVVKRLFHEYVDEAVFELVDLGGGRTDLGRAQGNQGQAAVGEAAHFLGKPLDAGVFGALHRCQGAQHPGHFVEALKQIAHGPVENPAQARQDLHRQGRPCRFRSWTAVPGRCRSARPGPRR